jgi:peptide-methionine (S)-S-oxide reductase
MSTASTGNRPRRSRPSARSLRFVALVTALAATVGAAHARPTPAPPPAPAKLSHALFAGGCFWSMEKAFEDVPGVQAATAGYSGGTVANPSYELVSTGTTGHYETVQVDFDPSRISYEKLLDIYWHNTDPTDAGGQFCDQGAEYRPVVFVADEAQRKTAEASKAALIASGVLKQPVATRILPAGPFYAAEDYHQHFFKTNAAHYNAYRIGCGRDRAMTALWGKDAHRGSFHQ